MHHKPDLLALSPRTLCVGMALHEALPVLPPNSRLADAAQVIMDESEEFQPDVQRLARAWYGALDILLDMSADCRIAALGMLLIEQLEDGPFSGGES